MVQGRRAGRARAPDVRPATIAQPSWRPAIMAPSHHGHRAALERMPIYLSNTTISICNAHDGNTPNHPQALPRMTRVPAGPRGSGDRYSRIAIVPLDKYLRILSNGPTARNNQAGKSACSGRDGRWIPSHRLPPARTRDEPLSEAGSWRSFARQFRAHGSIPLEVTHGW